MKVAVCVDDRGGMLFNNRRQSRDRMIIADFAAENTSILVNSYTAPLFDGYSVTVCDSPLDTAGEGDACFIENIPLSPVSHKITTLVVYRWNRTYPFDVCMDIDLSGFRLISTAEFQGSSHNKITKEIYSRI